MNSLVVTFARGAGGKTWVALITGRCRTYGLARDFIQAVKREGESADYILDAGLYEVCENGHRYFIEVKDGEWPDSLEIDKKVLYRMLIERTERRKAKRAAQEREKAAKEREIDGMIAHFNGEGGFDMVQPDVDPGSN